LILQSLRGKPRPVFFSPFPGAKTNALNSPPASLTSPPPASWCTDRPQPPPRKYWALFSFEGRNPPTPPENRAGKPMYSEPALAPCPGVRARGPPFGGLSAGPWLDPAMPAPAALPRRFLGKPSTSLPPVVSPPPPPFKGGAVFLLAACCPRLRSGFPGRIERGPPSVPWVFFFFPQGPLPEIFRKLAPPLGNLPWPLIFFTTATLPGKTVPRPFRPRRKADAFVSAHHEPEGPAWPVPGGKLCSPLASAMGNRCGPWKEAPTTCFLVALRLLAPRAKNRFKSLPLSLNRKAQSRHAPPNLPPNPRLELTKIWFRRPKAVA